MTAPSHRPSGSEPAEGSTPGPAAPAEGEEHDSHGQSMAAWVAVCIILVGSLIMSFAVVFPSVLWFVVGAVIAVLGAATGKVLAMAGYGAKAGTHEAAHASGPGQAELPGRSQHDSGTR
jgi:hypothetical protein